MTYEVECGWCKQPKDKPGWHDCPQSIAGRKRLGDTLVNIHELMVGGKEPIDDPIADEAAKLRKISLDKLGN